MKIPKRNTLTSKFTYNASSGARRCSVRRPEGTGRTSCAIFKHCHFRQTIFSSSIECSFSSLSSVSQTIHSRPFTSTLTTSILSEKDKSHPAYLESWSQLQHKAMQVQLHTPITICSPPETNSILLYLCSVWYLGGFVLQHRRKWSHSSAYEQNLPYYSASCSASLAGRICGRAIWRWRKKLRF